MRQQPSAINALPSCDAVELRAANLEVLREGPEFLAALPPKLRPMIPFVLRPRRGMPARVIR